MSYIDSMINNKDGNDGVIDFLNEADTPQQPSGDMRIGFFYGIRVVKKANGKYHVSEFRDISKLPDAALFVTGDAELLDRKDTVAFLKNVVKYSRQATF